MRAFFITAPGRTEIREISLPEIRPDEALLRVRLVGLCGSDLSTFRGRNPLVTLPRIPGHEVAGTIESAGHDVPAEWRAGTNVTLSPYTSCGECAACRRGRPNACRSNRTLGVQRDGALTEHIAVPWRKLYRSDRLGLKELCLVEPLTVGFHAVDRAEVSERDTVAVLGCGAIGLGAVAGAAWRKARVIAVDVDDAKLDTAGRSGAAHLVNSARFDLHDALRAIVPEGPDVIIEAVGLPATFRSAVEEVAFTGRVVYIGYAKEQVAYETKLFVQKEIDIRGSRNALGDFADVIAMLEEGRFPVEEAVTRTVTLDRAGHALAEWDRDPAAVTRILVDLAGQAEGLQ